MWRWFGKTQRPAVDEQWWRLVKREAVEIIDEETGETVELRAGRLGPNTARGLVLDFRYVDAAGVPSHRGLLCYRCFREEERLYVHGYCPFREDARTFRIDRMSDLFDVTDGIQIPVDDIAAFLGPRAEQGISDEAMITDMPYTAIEFVPPSAAQKEAQAIDEYLFKRARRDCVAGLRIIESIVKSDGIRGEEERTILRYFLESRLAMRGYDFNTALSDQLMQVAARLVPPVNLSKAIEEVVLDRAYFGLVRETATAMANVQGKQRQAVDDILFRLEAAGGEIGWL